MPVKSPLSRICVRFFGPLYQWERSQYTSLSDVEHDLEYPWMNVFSRSLTVLPYLLQSVDRKRLVVKCSSLASLVASMISSNDDVASIMGGPWSSRDANSLWIGVSQIDCVIRKVNN